MAGRRKKQEMLSKIELPSTRGGKGPPSFKIDENNAERAEKY